MSRTLRRLGFVVGAAALLLAGGVGYAAVKDGSTVIKACAVKQTGQLRLDTGNGCRTSEQAVQWNQTGPPGPPGPPGNSNSVVRHISQFMLDGTTASTPILSSRGAIGKLSLLCGHDANGGNGQIRFTQSSDASFQNRVIFYSPQVPISPMLVLSDPEVTFNWADTPRDNIMFEIMIEATPGTDFTLPPTVTDIHGFVQHFSSFGGCSFFVHMDTSDVSSGVTFTP
jgi:hypothetical protein